MPFQPEYEVRKDRRAYTLPGGRVGCLMLHGFMGSPTSSRPLADYLAGRSITMHCPLLPGHGELPNKLYQISHQDWIAEAEEGLAFLRQQCDEIFVMGHSMGTVLGAFLVDKYRSFRGLIMLAPLYDVPDSRIRLLRFLRYVMPWFYPMKFKRLHKLVEERIHDFDPSLDLRSPAVQERLPELTRVPTSGMDEMRKMADIGQKLWPKIDIPAVIFQGGRDIAVKDGNAQQIYDLLPNHDKTLRLFPEAGHELMRPFDPTHAQVLPQIYDFIAARSSLKDQQQLAVQAGQAS
jgi:carboxylesterase